MKRLVSILSLLIILIGISGCSASDKGGMEPDSDDSSAFMYEEIGSISSGNERLDVMMLSEVESVYYRYTSLGYKETSNTIINYQDNISYGKVKFSDDLSSKLSDLINENLNSINTFYNIVASCDKNNSVVTIEEYVTSGNVDDEIMLIEMFIPYMVNYSDGSMSDTSVMYIKVYNYITVISNGMIDLNGSSYNFEEFKETNNSFK